MALNHTINITYKDDAGQVTSTVATYSDTDETNVEVAVPPSTTNQLVNVSFPVNHLTSCVIYSDAALTLKTNSSGSPQETIVLAAKVGRIYTSDGAAGNPTIPFAGAITAFYLTNASSTVTANFKFRALYH